MILKIEMGFLLPPAAQNAKLKDNVFAGVCVTLLPEPLMNVNETLRK